MPYLSLPLSFMVGFCAITDFRSQKIPNLITLPAAILAFGLHFYDTGLAGLYFSLAGWALGFLLLIIPYAMGLMGAGDVKLLAAIGAFVGTSAVLGIFLYTSLFGAVLALYHYIISKKIQHNFEGFFQSVKHLILFRKNVFSKPSLANKRFHLSYGIAMAAGTYVYLGESIGLYRIIG